MESVLKSKAVELRLEGKSLKEISGSLGISKSTASLWLRAYPLDDVKERMRLGSSNGGTRNKIEAKEIRLKYQMAGRELARQKDIEHNSGCMLYWAEGTKSKNRATFTNSDASMLKTYKDFVLKFFDVELSEFKLYLNCYLGNGLTKEDVESYWSSFLGITSFGKGSYKKELKDSFRKNRHSYGVCSIVLYRTDVVQSIYGSIQEYMNIDRPEWLQ